MIIYGTRMYGSYDAIDGLGVVSTRFIHIFWIPLIPIGTIFVTGEDEDGYRGVDLPFSIKAAFATYVRTFALLMGVSTMFSVVMSCMGLVTLVTAGAGMEALGAVLSMGVSVCWLSFNLMLWFGTGWLFGTASKARREQIFVRLGLDESDFAE